MPMDVNANIPSNFIRNIIEQDLSTGKHKEDRDQVPARTQWLPAYIGHAKSMCLNFGLATGLINGTCHLRFDDTNPEKERGGVHRKHPRRRSLAGL